MTPKRTKIGLVNLGCPKNQVDSEVMLGTLKQDGFDLTNELNKAEVIIINTCGFVDTAKEESINTIIEYGQLKKKGCAKVLIAAGCLAQRYPDELMKDLPELNAVVGTGDFPKIAEIVRQHLKGAVGSQNPATKSFVNLPPHLYLANSPRIRLSQSHWAYVKASEGCNYRCSFCAIPSFRGDLVSRSIEDILTETRRLAQEGVKEINLISQSLTSFGWDRRDRGALIQLLSKMVKIEGIKWIRLYYTYPSDFSDDLIKFMASEPKICNYVDIPLQHINDSVLRKMNRKGDSRLIRSLLKRIRSGIPNVAIRTTMIVGFPGETEEAFQELYRFVEELKFDRVGVFTYSHEDGTSAFAIEDTIPSEIKSERQTTLWNLQNEIALSKHQSMVGSFQIVLVDGLATETEQIEGRLEGQAPEIDGVVILEGEARPGEFMKVEITGATDSDLTGRVISGF